MLERLRRLLAREPITEKKMFGGHCLLYQGNMLCGVHKDGTLMMRMGKELEPEARKLPGASDMTFTGRKMGGLLYVDLDAVETDAALQEWLDICLRFTRSLPAK